jgi:hypothetical protein
MVEVLKTNTTLRTVALDGEVLSIAELTSASSVMLSRKRLGDASGLVIAHLLSGRAMRWLDLSHNSFSSSTWEEIFKAASKGAFDRVTGMPLQHQLQCCLKVVDLTELQTFVDRNLEVDGCYVPSKGYAHGIHDSYHVLGPLTSEEATRLSKMPFDDSRSAISSAASPPFKTVAALREAWRTGQGCAFCSGWPCGINAEIHCTEEHSGYDHEENIQTTCALCSSFLSRERIQWRG